MMDGRDFGPHRSVHVPPPLLSGLAMESHRLGAAAAAGRIPPSPGHLGAGHPAALHTGKFLSSAMNLHSHHSDAFPGASSPFLSGYVSASNAHGGPNPLSSDPAFRTPNPASLQMAQLWASHPHEGFTHLPSSLYTSPYIPLGHLDHQQLSQHALFDPQKEGFYLPGSLHSQSAMARSPVAHMPGSLSREKEALPSHKSSKDSSRELGKDKPCKSDQGHSFSRKERERQKEESRPHSVVDLTQDVKAEDERRSGNSERHLKTAEHTRPFFHQHSPAHSTMDTKPKQSHQSFSSTPARHPSVEQERRDRDRDDDNSRPGGHLSTEKQKRCDSAATSAGNQHVSYASPSTLQPNPSHLPPRLVSSGTYPPPHHMPPSMYPLYSTAKEPGKEHRVIAPTYVPSVEVYEERKGPIQIASQARDNKNDKSRERESYRSALQVGNERTHMDHSRSNIRSELPPHGDFKRDVLREEGSIIRSNGLATKKPLNLEVCASKAGNSPDARDSTNTTSKHTVRTGLEAESRSQDRDRVQRSAHPFSGMDPGSLHPEQHSLNGLGSAEPKWKPFEMGNYATSHMAALAAQHAHDPRGEEDSKRMNTTGLHRPAGSGGSPKGHGEVSAMQSLIKYSGNFSSESGSRHGSDSCNPFGGLGSMKPEASYSGVSRIQHLPPQQSGKQLKREPERPESAKSFGRDGSSSQGDGEVRHPPVGIAVAVARQKDNSKSRSISDRDRPLLVGTIKGPIHAEEEQGDERARHRDERLLVGRLERDQDKVLRDTKEDYNRLHPPMVSASGLNPNLMVTGGPTLAGAGRWPADPSSHLASHPWLPRPGAPSMWLSGSPYGLGPSSLHQALPPGYPSALTGSIPPPYQFARDPQTGQLVVISTEHLPHYAEMLERGPPLWSAVYPQAGSSLQHAHQLQLLSHQQLLRQQELYMIQHQTAQVIELQRNAQLVERLNASQPRTDLEEKPDKRTSEGTKASLSVIPAPPLHSRKPPPRSSTPSTSYSKALTPQPVAPLPSPVSAMKSEDRPKVEKTLPQKPYSHPSSPVTHPVRPASVTVPTVSLIRPKEESVEVPEKESLGLQKQPSAPFPSMYPEIPPGYPYQSITAPFGSHYPYLLQTAAAADTDGLAPDVPLSAETSEHLPTTLDVKPRYLCSPVVVEPLQVSTEPEPIEESTAFKREPSVEVENVLSQNSPRLLHSAFGSFPTTHDSTQAEAHPTITPPPRDEQEQDSREVVKIETISSSPPRLYDSSSLESERTSKAEAGEDSTSLHSSLTYTDASSVVCDIQPANPPLDLSDRKSPIDLREPDAPHLESIHDNLFLPNTSPPHLQPAPVAILPEDPMAGMIALVTASELPQAGAVSVAAKVSSFGSEICPGVSLLESTALEGMALLSQMAELEMQRQPREDTQGVMLCGLESLLEAGRQILLEAIECQPEVIICLPRELNPNKKYSWRQKKDEPMFSKSSLEGMDAAEVVFRVMLAELQQRYKEKQRELVKLQRRRDKEEKRQQQQIQQQERNRSLARRGPGRPRKRKHGMCALSPPSGKLDSKCAKLGKSVLYSEDSESGEVLRKRFRASNRDEEEESSAMRLKKKKKSWSEQEAFLSYSHETPKMGMKKSRLSEQEQLASKLDKALSLTKIGKLGKPSCKIIDGSSGKSRANSGSRIPMLTDIDMRVKMGKSGLSKDLSIFLKSSKGGKSKMGTKTKPSDPCLKGKGQRKAPYSPVRSEISSYSNNTDSEEDESLQDGWPPSSMLRRTGPRPQLPGLCSTPSKKVRSSSKIASSSSSSLKSKQAAKERKHKHFALLLQEAGVSSSEDSFDQEYFTERDDYEDDDDEDEFDYELEESDGLCSSFVEESGLGLLARFAASAIPSPIVTNPISVVQLEAKQKAKKKEERQSLLGTEFEFTDSENDVKTRKKFPSLLHGKRSAPELPLLPPASVMRVDSSPSKRGRKPKKPKSPREFSFDLTAEGSEDEQWTRRRSERIFLHDAAQATPVTLSNKTPLPLAPKPARGPKASPQGPKELARVKEVKDPNKKKRIKESPMNLPQPQVSSTPSENSGALPVSPGRKSKVKPKAKEQARGKGGAVSKLMESMAADEDFEPNQDSSFSEDENPPMSAQPERPSTPAPRNCVINKDELQDGLRVLIPMDDKLLYAGHVSTVHSPDIYSVVVEGERGNRPHIYCLEQLLQEAIIDVKPPSVRYLPQGTRIAAYWSQQYRCLYPGTVVRGSPDMEEVDDLITVEFDDGDTGRIPLSHIRLLPPDYKIQCAEPSPALLVASTKRRGRKCSKDVPEGKETPLKSTEEAAPKSRGRGRKPKPKPEPEVAPKEHEKTDTTAPTQVSERPLSSPKSSLRPGSKIKQVSTASASIPVSNESQKKYAGIKPPVKVRSQPLSVYSPPLYGKVLSVDLYNEPCTSVASFKSNNETETPAGKGKPVKRLRKAEEETSGFGLKMQRKQPQTEILIKLDHEGVMSPKTKKTKALMMMEGQNLSKRDNKSVMGVDYTTVSAPGAPDKTLKSKTKPADVDLSESASTYSVRKLGSDGLIKVNGSSEKGKECHNCSSSSSSSSESEGEEERGTSQDKKPKPVSTSSNSSRASSFASSSSSTSSSSSSAGSSSSSSTSSTTSDEESSCSSDEEPVAASQSSPAEQTPHKCEEEKINAKSGPPANLQKLEKQQASTTEHQQQKPQKVKQGVGRPKKREGIHLPTTKELAKRQRLPSVENRPKISAFLPARQLWKWFGKPTQRRGMKGKAKKLFYKAIMRGKEMICIGDCAVFLSAGRPNLPFIGHIQSMWESWGNNMVVRVKWFYHPEETNPGKKLHDKKNWDQMSGQSLPTVLQASNQRKDFMERALYQSSHIDENDVQTISHKCLVVSLEQYELMIKTKKYQDSEDLYYLAGTYEPTTGMIFNTDGVPVIC
ncbi:trinucleotide repeat-containing gene 18 protein isoform X3 [Triplophysa dalaica]|uniref:trinucleotide repeat-containing gene 18 protein isoform X3 n=1 Tax=Triplophysa dalaica TaxID=1582913 RepID=UPI0024DFAD8E|nr:trinucleotide repeat-containing gene 18 protein isoform X3 [Triplophysa dalaica]